MLRDILKPVMAFAVVAMVSSPAMSIPKAHCRVIGAEKLPSNSGGASAICSAIERAIAARAPRTDYAVEVRVRSKSALSAKLIVARRELPEHHFAVSDNNLGPDSIARFAQVLADAVVQARRSA